MNDSSGDAHIHNRRFLISNGRVTTKDQEIQDICLEICGSEYWNFNITTNVNESMENHISYSSFLLSSNREWRVYIKQTSNYLKGQVFWL